MPVIAQFKVRDFNGESLHNFLHQLTVIARDAGSSYGNAYITFEPDPIEGMGIEIICSADETATKRGTTINAKFQAAWDAYFEVLNRKSK